MNSPAPNTTKRRLTAIGLFFVLALLVTGLIAATPLGKNPSTGTTFLIMAGGLLAGDLGVRWLMKIRVWGEIKNIARMQ